MAYATLEILADRVWQDMARFFEKRPAKLNERLHHLLANPDYNYVIRSAPHHSAGEPHFHWYVEILPRLTTRAGFEIGSGMNINVVAPEIAADGLRKAL